MSLSLRGLKEVRSGGTLKALLVLRRTGLLVSSRDSAFGRRDAKLAARDEDAAAVLCDASVFCLFFFLTVTTVNSDASSGFSGPASKSDEK